MKWMADGPFRPSFPIRDTYYRFVYPFDFEYPGKKEAGFQLQGDLEASYGINSLCAS